MTPNDAALALLALLKLPDGAANVLVWQESALPSLRVWVADRYLWDAMHRAPSAFENYAEQVVPRPDISAKKNVSTHPYLDAMNAISPQTICDDVTRDLEAFQDSLKYYASPTDLRVSRLDAEIKKLAKTDAFAAHVSWGVLHQLKGDAEKMRYHFQNASRIGDRIKAAEHATVGEINLGYASRAQELFRTAADPETGNFTAAYRLGAVCGAFQLLDGYIAKAEQMQIDTTGLNTPHLRHASRILKTAGVTDAQVAAMLDLAGEVLREHKTLFSDAEFVVDRTDRCVHVRFNLLADPYVTAELFDQLADKIARRIDPIPDAFHVSFRPGGSAK
jgi:hypothetical protein